MRNIMKMFVDSAKEFKKLRSVATVALLVALHTIMAMFLSIQVTTSLRISISFLANVVVGAMFGPVMGLAAGGIGDIIQFVIRPTGPYFVGWTINASLAGLIYGCFFYGRRPKEIQKNNTSSGKIDMILGVISSSLSAFAIVVLMVMPFLEVTVKTEEGSSTMTASAVNYLLFANSYANAKALSAIILVVCILLVVMPLIKKHKTALFIAVVGTFLAILSVYTDKKTTSALVGFWVAVVLLLLYIVLQFCQVARKNSMDVWFLARCIVALTIDTLLVNVLLGTYWVSFMYGKGFAFYFTTRLIKNVVQLPINIMLSYYVIEMLKKVKIDK